MHRRRVLPAVAVLIAVAAGFAALAVLLPHEDLSHDPVTIPRGAGLLEIGGILDSADVVSSRLLFAGSAVVAGKANRMQSGTYLFPQSLSIREAIAILAAGSHQVESFVTIPEGATVRKIASILRSRMSLDSARVMALCSDRAFLRSQRIAAPSAEGYLMPDTYTIRADARPEQILSRMIRRLREVLTRDDSAMMRARGRSLHAILTMASLVEGETRLPAERARIAGVYYNRLKRGMRLQADPTIQYIIPDSPRRLLYRDLEIDSPYNTYKRRGLPPGPVNNPGAASIRAALRPERHNFLYFVANGRGGHVFSRNAGEHAAAVAAYRKQQEGAGQ